MSKETKFEHIAPEEFEFVQKDAHLHDTKLETKAHSFFQDALRRFAKNKSSVVAAWILLFLVIFALAAPALSPYTIQAVYQLSLLCAGDRQAEHRHYGRREDPRQSE